jgi:hypothetical protein
LRTVWFVVSVFEKFVVELDYGLVNRNVIRVRTVEGL